MVLNSPVAANSAKSQILVKVIVKVTSIPNDVKLKNRKDMDTSVVHVYKITLQSQAFPYK